jgi:hypothetical protein
MLNVPSPAGRALNKALLRSVNEEIAGLSRTLAASDAPAFVCECARIECTAQVRLTLAEYEQMRRHDSLYVVARGHEIEPTRGDDTPIVRADG